MRNNGVFWGYEGAVRRRREEEEGGGLRCLIAVGQMLERPASVFF